MSLWRTGNGSIRSHYAPTLTLDGEAAMGFTGRLYLNRICAMPRCLIGSPVVMR